MNVLATNFNSKSILKYVYPTVLMLIFWSSYTVVDGFFVASLVGENALSAINIVLPIISLLMAISLMFATGGTAVMGKLMGEGKDDEARSFLSLLYLIAFLFGGGCTIVFLSFPDEIVQLLGAKGNLIPYAKDYLISYSTFTLSLIFQVFVQSFFVLAGKPKLGFISCFIGGITNIILDYIFISPVLLDMGIKGAGYATGIGNTIPALIGIIYFIFNRKGVLYFGRLKGQWRILIQSMLNGSSELVSQLSTAVTTLLFNVILFNLLGESGVAAVSVIIYIQMIQIAIYLGYSIGIIPIISYKYGANDKNQLKSVMKTSFVFIGIMSMSIIVLSLVFDDVLVGIFINPNSQTFKIAKDGFRIFSIAYVFMGFNLLISSMFTALSNAKISAILSLCRTLVFIFTSLMLLPKFIGVIGVWLAVPFAESLAFILSIYCYKNGKSKYGY